MKKLKKNIALESEKSKAHVFYSKLISGIKEIPDTALIDCRKKIPRSRIYNIDRQTEKVQTLNYTFHPEPQTPCYKSPLQLVNASQWVGNSPRSAANPPSKTWALVGPWTLSTVARQENKRHENDRIKHYSSHIYRVN